MGKLTAVSMLPLRGNYPTIRVLKDYLNALQHLQYYNILYGFRRNKLHQNINVHMNQVLLIGLNSED